jgi:hypothetical protein
MNVPWLLSASTALALLVPVAAAAQPVSGQIGRQSRATIGLSVSVMPRFEIDRIVTADGRGSSGHRVPALSIRSNVNALRFALVDDDSSEPVEAAGDRRTVLIVPD